MGATVKLVDFGWRYRSGRKRLPQDPGSKNGTWGTVRVSSDYEREKPTYAGHPPSWNEDNGGPTLAKTARMGHPPYPPMRFFSNILCATRPSSLLN